MPLAAGSRLGPYEILAPIGAGGMGEVYRARDTRLGRDVAVKVLPAGKVDGERLQRFLREARAASQLNHPNVVAIYDIGEHEGVHFIVMEYVDGQTLSDATPRGGMEPDAVVRFAKQIVAALVKAHDAGIVHRDLKPANIMRARDGSIKVLDFGLARIDTADDDTAALTAETQPGAILGTASYMSPEQATGRPADARSDIFSLGLVLYEMLSGQRAFQGDNAVSTLAAIITQEPRNLRDVAPRTPSEVERIVRRCMRKEPGKRFQSAVDLQLALEDLGAPAMSAETPSIAVLPFANLSADPENEYFSDGLAEEILNALTQLPGLRVIARASAFAFRGREHELGAIAEKLKVQSILQGSVRRSGNRIRVTAQLIGVADESQLWSERYDREMTDVFEIQDEVARAIVDKLKVKLTSKPDEPLVKRYTENSEAHSLYLKGVFHLNRYTPDDIEKAARYLHAAVAMEPQHAQGWAQLAEYYVHRAFMPRGPANVEMPQVLFAAQHAVAADPSLAAGHAALAIVTGFYEFRWDDALRIVESAAHLPPSPWYYIWGGCVYWAHGRLADAERHLVKVLDLDPLSGLARYLLGLLNNYLGRYDKAVAYSLEALEMNPDFPSPRAMLGIAYAQLGRLDEGVEQLEQALRSLPGAPGFAGYLGVAYVRAGRRADAERFLAQLLARCKETQTSPFAAAWCAMGLNNVDMALECMETVVKERDPWLGFMPGNPDFEPLRSNENFREIMAPVNLPNYP